VAAGSGNDVAWIFLAAFRLLADNTWFTLYYHRLGLVFLQQGGLENMAENKIVTVWVNRELCTLAEQVKLTNFLEQINNVTFFLQSGGY
jgi:hypothetical protein